jgi:hypothetical protein
MKCTAKPYYFKSMVVRAYSHGLLSELLSMAQIHAKAAPTLACWKPLHFKISEGQVGQESHRQPAVLEHAARCPESSKVVQIALETADLGGISSRIFQERPAAM